MDKQDSNVDANSCSIHNGACRPCIMTPVGLGDPVEIDGQLVWSQKTPDGSVTMTTSATGHPAARDAKRSTENNGKGECETPRPSRET